MAAAFRLYILLGIAATVLLAGLTHVVSQPSFPAAVPLYLALLALARLGVMVFPAVSDGRQLSRAGLFEISSPSTSSRTR